MLLALLQVTLLFERRSWNIEAINESQREVHDSISFDDEACDNLRWLFFFLYFQINERKWIANNERRRVSNTERKSKEMAHAVLIISRTLLNRDR